jgi:hypothetical protein
MFSFWGWTVLGVVTGVVFPFLLYRWLLKLARRRVKKVEERFGKSNILLLDERANCFGVESEGFSQIRGNGVLALTPGEVYFLMWLPEKEVQIPVSAIAGVETTRTHLGKSKGQPLLKVKFKNRKGEDDSAAWLVSDLQEWKHELQKITG